MKLSNTLIVCALGASMLSPTAFGQTEKPRYRITDLGDLITNPAIEDNAISYGLNDQNEVTGNAAINGGFLHAFIWLPIPAYGLPQGMHDIGPGSSSTRTSRGNDIANTGHVTGRNFFHALDPFISHAFVWNPLLPGESHLRMKDLGELIPELLLAPPCDDSNITSCDPDSLPIPPVNSEGWSIASGFAVGASGTVVGCPQEGENPEPHSVASFTTDSRGFLDDTSFPITPLDLDLKPLTDMYDCTAYSISTPTATNPTRIVGIDWIDDEAFNGIPVYWPAIIGPGAECTPATAFGDALHQLWTVTSFYPRNYFGYANYGVGSASGS